MRRWSEPGRGPHPALAAALALLPVVAVLLTSCDALVPEPFPNTPTGNFEALWHDLDQHYALFGVRHVDWDSLYQVYRPRVSDGSSDEELAVVLCDLLGELDDGHVYLAALGTTWCSADGEDRLPSFVTEVGGYYMLDWDRLADPFEGAGVIGGTLQTPATAGRNLAYLWLDNFRDSTDWAAVDSLLGAAAASEGLVIDLRGNPGGSSRHESRVADLVADAGRPYLQIKRRNGPAHDDLAPPEIISMDPAGAGLGAKPLVTLTDRRSSSAAEWFTLAMRVRAGAQVVGDTTKGIFSGRYDRVLPNGWEYSSCADLVLDMEGICWEGIGLAPDHTVLPTPEAYSWGLDLALDEAVRLLLAELEP